MKVRRYELKMKAAKVWEVPDTKVNTAIDVWNFATQYLRMQESDRETFYVIALSSKGDIIGCNLAHLGELNSCVVSVREIMKFAILSNASSVIFLHNHPSGDSTPSQEDISLTHRLGEACRIMNITMADHIVIGDDNHTSLRAIGLI